MIRRARPDELVTLVQLRRQAAAWLAAQGLDQWVEDWPSTEEMVVGVAQDLQHGHTWLAVDDSDQVHGTVTVKPTTYPGLWTSEEEATALFASRLIVDRAAAGQGIGALLLDFAGQLAQEQGREWLRLDAWTTNTRLHAYYRQQGFRHVRTVGDFYTPSAACFERPAAYRSSDTPPKLATSTGYTGQAP